MKNNKWKNRFALVLAAFVLALTGCGKNDGGAATPPPAPPVTVAPPPILGSACGMSGMPACPGGGTSMLAAALGYSLQKDVVMGLSFFSQGGVAADPTIPYYGTYIAQGTLMITAAPTTSCPIPPGTYQVSGTGTSSWQNGAGIQLQLQAVGPTSFTFSFVNGFLGSAPGGAMVGPGGTTYPYYLAGYVAPGGNCYPWYIGL